MFERIIVPLDGSPRAEQALPVAACIAHASGSSIHLLQVLSSVVDYGGLGAVPFVTEQSVEMELSQATDYLSTVAASSVLTGIPTTIEAMFGLPAQCILATAESREVDLIVLCSHGRTGFLRWALGSVAHTLAHESTVPTLVLRESDPASLLSSTKTTRPPRVLVPLDGSELSETALAPAVHLIKALAAPAQGAMHLAEVVKLIPLTAQEDFANESNEETLQHARAYLTQMTERVQTSMKNLSVTSSVELEKDVSSALLHLAEHGAEGKDAKDPGPCDLIAISTHGRGGLERWVMGSVTERLLTSTKLPMLIVRPQKNR